MTEVIFDKNITFLRKRNCDNACVVCTW